jgi:hypothetical protein
MTFISIQTLAERAKAQGFHVSMGHDGTYAELYPPEHASRPDAIHWGGATYATAEYVLNSRPAGYGYNPFFYGPFHPGLVRTESASVQRLLARLN